MYYLNVSHLLNLIECEDNLRAQRRRSSDKLPRNPIQRSANYTEACGKDSRCTSHRRAAIELIKCWNAFFLILLYVNLFVFAARVVIKTSLLKLQSALITWENSTNAAIYMKG